MFRTIFFLADIPANKNEEEIRLHTVQRLQKTNPCLDEEKTRNPPSIAAQSVSVNSFPFLFVFLIAQNVALQADGAR